MSEPVRPYPEVEFPGAVSDLVERFERNRTSYESAAYTETALRREFLDPLFRSLGWDVDNTGGIAEAYKDVIHEGRLEGAEVPDYAFRIGGVRKFFVEAKRPAVSLRRDPGPAFQLRRYSWSAKLPLGVVTNFAEFSVYDTRIQPSAADLPPVARILYVRAEEYESRWREIAGVFSRDALWKGWFDKFGEATRGKRGTAEVDAAFLAEMESWRLELAKNLALRNASLKQGELNFLVQATIDRIVFLRICEDRGLEPHGALEQAVAGRNVYGSLVELFKKADARYNSGLFHFELEPGRSEQRDVLSPSVAIGDHILKDIVRRLYYPVSPYAFSVLSPDILGQVYERFLGKQILLTGTHQIRVEDKPDVRRAGGVYYTPEYVVAHIIEHSLERSLKERVAAGFHEGKEPLPGFSVLDPACGSGSFLIQAYQALLDWYLGRYESDPSRWERTKPPRLFAGPGGTWRLTTAERKRILLQHIHGVDIDAQAVEVTKLSLLLKVLEEESSESIQADLRLLQERALPDLGENIKSGNSLVSTDIYSEPGVRSLSPDAVQRLNAFDWKHEFPRVKGGFDVVVGNPPYLYRKAEDDVLVPYYREKYQSAEGNFELYKFFVERGMSLLREGGRLGFILSATFLVQDSFERLRTLLLTESTIERLAPMGPGVFKGVAVDTAILIARRGAAPSDHSVQVQAPIHPAQLPIARVYEIPQSRFLANPRRAIDYRLDDSSAKLVERLREVFPRIEIGFEFGVGINTGSMRAEMLADHQLDQRYRPMVPGSGIDRYGPVRTKGWIMYDPAFVRSRGTRGRSLPPQRFFDEPKILVVRTRNLGLPRRLVATLDESGAYNLNRLTNIIARPGYSLVGLLGILNSSLFNWIFAGTFYDYEIKPTYLRTAPMADVNNADLIRWVETIREATGRIAAARTPRERDAEARRLGAAETELDDVVATLFGLTTEERKTVDRYRDLVEKAEAARRKKRRS